MIAILEDEARRIERMREVLTGFPRTGTLGAVDSLDR
jgi:hypothetical protein